jgi:DNA-binding NtrC family response regulator
MTGPPSASDPTAQPGRVLVVEDDPATRDTLLAVLDGEAFQLEGVASASEALAAFGRGKFDVVVADYHLGDGEDGARLLARLTSLEPGLSAMLLTGHTDFREVREVQKSGRFLVLFKPADPKELLAWVKNGVVMARLNRTMSRIETRRLRPHTGGSGAQ